MELEFSDEQEELREGVRAMLSRECPMSLVRSVVESLSGHLASQLNARQLDLAVLYGSHAARRWNVSPLLMRSL